MPKRAKELSALDIKRAVHPGGTDRHYWLEAGIVAGLRLQITAAGTKSWVLRVMIGDRRRVLGLGAYPEVGLAEARDKAREAKRKIAEGIDPIEERKAVRAALAAASARNLLFPDAVDKWIAAKISDRPEKKPEAIKSTITRYALPELGKLTVQQITVQDIA